MAIQSVSPEKNPISVRIFIIAGIAAVMVITTILALAYLPPAGPTHPGSGSLVLNISGSTTVQPVSESLANSFMQKNPGVRVNVAGGGSGAGISRVGTGKTDIGASSRNLNPDELQKYPDLRTFQMGGSAVVVIVNYKNSVEEADKSELQTIYNTKSDDIANLMHLRNITTVIQRSDSSGTEETFAQWLDPNNSNLDDAMNVTDHSGTFPVKPLAVEGNEEVVLAVARDPGAIGFADFGFAEREPGVKIIRLQENASQDALPREINGARELIRQELRKGGQKNTFYISRLTRPLLYITNGPPTELENEFIRFASSPDSSRFFDDVGYFSATEFNYSG